MHLKIYSFRKHVRTLRMKHRRMDRRTFHCPIPSCHDRCIGMNRYSEPYILLSNFCLHRMYSDCTEKRISCRSRTIRYGRHTRRSQYLRQYILRLNFCLRCTYSDHMEKHIPCHSRNSLQRIRRNSFPSRLWNRFHRNVYRFHMDWGCIEKYIFYRSKSNLLHKARF